MAKLCGSLVDYGTLKSTDVDLTHNSQVNIETTLDKQIHTNTEMEYFFFV